MREKITLPFLLVLFACASSDSKHDDGPGESVTTDRYTSGWFSWRGPNQNGTTDETGLVESIEVGGANHLWSYEIAGRGTPTLAGGRVYAVGYEGEGPDLREVLLCLDEFSGELIWELRASDFLSDVIYDRYAIASPTIDPETGNVYWLTTGGVFKALDADGKLLWEHVMGSEYGRLTFPNGRTGAALIEGDTAIIHIISAAWGPLGPARDRFFAFDKITGVCKWVSTPGEGPKDSSFSYPVVEWRDGRRLLYAGTGCGNMAAIDALTGEPVWRYKMSVGGVNSSALIHGDRLIAIHGKENMDSSTIGRMVSIPLGRSGETQVQMGAGDEAWRTDLVAFTSSPALVGDRVYQTVATGELYCLDVNSGEKLWHTKLAPDQIHASPVWGDGKLYVPMTNGSFHIVRPTADGPEILDSDELGGSCLGAPAIYNGKILVHTTERLYCFGSPRGVTVAKRSGEASPDHGPAVRARIVPADVTIPVGGEADFHVEWLDAHGNVVPGSGTVSWKETPTGVGTLFLEGATSRFRASSPRSFMISAAAGELPVTPARVRTVARVPFMVDFEGGALDQGPPDDPFAWPDSSWIGAKPKWDIRELDGNRVFAKTLTNPLFQRNQFYIGDPSEKDYVMQVDMMTDGNRRTMSAAGVLHQRYLIQLKGNYQELEVSSNHERIKESVPFRIRPKVWYRLKTSVVVNEDGSGVVRAKAWPRDEPEPDAWLIEVDHKNAHTRGAPGLFGFAPQSRFKVYLDNLVVTPAN